MPLVVCVKSKHDLKLVQYNFIVLQSSAQPKQSEHNATLLFVGHIHDGTLHEWNLAFM